MSGLAGGCVVGSGQSRPTWRLIDGRARGSGSLVRLDAVGVVVEGAERRRRSCRVAGPCLGWRGGVRCSHGWPGMCSAVCSSLVASTSIETRGRPVIPRAFGCDLGDGGYADVWCRGALTGWFAWGCLPGMGIDDRLDWPEPDVPPGLDVELFRSVRARCVVAAQATLTALDAHGDGRDELAEWARRSSITALYGVVEGEFWDQLRTDAAARPGPQAAAWGPVRDLLSESLAGVLDEVGYRPPPPAWILVRDARRSVDKAVAGSGSDYRKARKSISSILSALEDLEVQHMSAGEVRHLLRRTGFVLVHVAAGAGLLMTHGALEEVGKEVLLPAVVSVIDHGTGGHVGPQLLPSVRHESAAVNQQDVETKAAIRAAKLRKAVAEAELAELELSRAMDEAGEGEGSGPQSPREIPPEGRPRPYKR